MRPKYEFARVPRVFLRVPRDMAVALFVKEYSFLNAVSAWFGW